MARIEFAFGSLSFSGEGTETWLSAQLERVIDAAPALGQLSPPMVIQDEPAREQGAPAGSAEFTASLATHIRAKGGDSNQVKRFLATADWLRQKGATPLNTGAVTKALSANHQKKLSNPADCLNKLVARGFCEKNEDGFFITPDGLADLGY
ncbi:hypothetical protein [Aureimonas mangrovi]|uniref:hypothetical protein n=1 Tax=Aureimonas mangrovi TaxID=2758041 RepID=UPI00163D6509|nr:hypothetical protein [Aureimonas mangrovi]